MTTLSLQLINKSQKKNNKTTNSVSVGGQGDDDSAAGGGGGATTVSVTTTERTNDVQVYSSANSYSMAFCLFPVIVSYGVMAMQVTFTTNHATGERGGGRRDETKKGRRRADDEERASWRSRRGRGGGPGLGGSSPTYHYISLHITTYHYIPH